MSNLAIETHQLTFFGDFCAVDGIDLRVEQGTFYGFLGPNGAGKSTTIKMLTGLLAPSQGKILVLGKNMLDPHESLTAKSRVGVVAEDLALFDNLTARENGRHVPVSRQVGVAHGQPTPTPDHHRFDNRRLHLDLPAA